MFINGGLIRLPKICKSLRVNVSKKPNLIRFLNILILGPIFTLLIRHYICLFILFML